ncbi:MAG TPA: FecR domain-containing protein [Puia sp.]
MPKHPIHIEELIIKYARGERLRKEELLELHEWQSRSADHESLPDKFKDPDWLRQNLKRLEDVPSDRMWDFIRERIALSVQTEPARSPGHLRRLSQWGPYAAVIISVLVAGGLLINSLKKSGGAYDLPMPEITRANPKVPGNHQVLLTLGDGRMLPLDHIPNGKIAEAGNLILTKTDSNELVYSLKSGSMETAINSRITTGQTQPFRLVFPDGSKVQLSYASSLSTAFHEGRREMTLVGEALFETAKNSHQPFSVLTKKALVQVLGTKFDVTSYEDESTDAVSLISGSVKVMHGNDGKVLKPLQQALVTRGQLAVRNLPDSFGILSWTEKEPCFYFENADLSTVIRRIARWHQVKIHNPDNVAGIPITGKFRQRESLEAVLGMIDRAESGSAFLKRNGDTIEVSAPMASR